MPYSPFDSQFSTHNLAVKKFISGVSHKDCPQIMLLRALSSHLQRISNSDNNADYFDFVQLQVKIPSMCIEISKETENETLIELLKPIIAMTSETKKYREKLQKEHNPYEKQIARTPVAKK